MVTDAAGTAFNVFDTSTNKGRWVRHEDKDAALQVKGFDPAHNVLEIEQNGRPARLALKRSTIQAGQSIGAMIPAPAPVAGAGITSIQPGRRGGSLAGNAGAADAVRLKAVAEEIQKRRELRRAALAKASLSANPPSSALPTPGS